MMRSAVLPLLVLLTLAAAATPRASRASAAAELVTSPPLTPDCKNTPLLYTTSFAHYNDLF